MFTFAPFCLRVFLASLFLLTFSAVLIGQGVWSPVKRPSEGDLVSVFFTSENRGFIGGDSGYFAITENGGNSWNQINLTTNDNVNEIYFRNDDNGYLLVGKRIFISNDSGRSWRESRALLTSELNGLTPEFLSVRFSSKNRGWIVGGLANKEDEIVESLIMQTRDSGETWSRVLIPEKTELFHVDFANDDNGWIVGDQGVIYRTTDGGNSWVKLDSGTTESLYNVDFRDSKNGIVVGGRGTILRTENGGLNWQKISSDATKSLLRVSFVNDKTGWIVGAGGMVLRTEDRGRTWQRQNSTFVDSLFGLYMDKRGGWVVGRKGLILKFLK